MSDSKGKRRGRPPKSRSDSNEFDDYDPNDVPAKRTRTRPQSRSLAAEPSTTGSTYPTRSRARAIKYENEMKARALEKAAKADQEKATEIDQEKNVEADQEKDAVVDKEKNKEEDVKDNENDDAEEQTNSVESLSENANSAPEKNSDKDVIKTAASDVEKGEKPTDAESNESKIDETNSRNGTAEVEADVPEEVPEDPATIVKENVVDAEKELGEANDRQNENKEELVDNEPKSELEKAEDVAVNVAAMEELASAAVEADTEPEAALLCPEID